MCTAIRSCHRRLLRVQTMPLLDNPFPWGTSQGPSGCLKPPMTPNLHQLCHINYYILDLWVSALGTGRDKKKKLVKQSRAKEIAQGLGT